jgi:two-component system invasion response regulator UvrY
MTMKNAKSGGKSTRILIGDDHYVVREGLKQVLADKCELVEFGEASDGNEVLQLVWSQDWDIVVLDISMPGRGGLDTLKEISRAKPKLPVIVLSMHAEAQYAVRALKLGAYAYIQKDSAGTELVNAVNAVLCGERYITPAVANQLARALHKDHSELPHEALSDREYRVFCLLGSGKTVKDVSKILSLSAKTVSTYRVRILEKMGFVNNSQITHYVVKNGLSTGET